MRRFRQTLRLGQIATLVLIAGMAATGIGVLHLINRRTGEVTYTYANGSRDIASVRVEAERLLTANRKYLVSGADSDLVHVADVQHAILSELARMKSRVTSVSHDLASVEADVHAYVERFASVSRLRPTTHDPDELLGRFEREIGGVADRLEHDLAALRDAEDKNLDDELSRLAHLTSLAQLTIGVSSLLAAILAVALGRHVRATLGLQVAKLEAAREQAKLEAERRQELLSIVSHDLRTPLNAVALSAAVLEHEHTNERAARVVARAAEHMRRLVDQLIDLARVDAGQVPLDLSRFSGGDVIDELVMLVGPQAQRQCVELVVDTVRCRAVADRERVLQILSNLASNALRVLGDCGTIVLRVRPRDDYVRFEVTDDGPGIAPARVATLFERTVHRLEDRGSGLGLGLYICRKLVEAQRGRIGVTTELGEGTTFWFELPADSSSRA